jgi:hypothetical protein
MNNLTNLHQKLDATIRTLNISNSIALAIERTNTEPFNIENMVKDIDSEFKRISDDDIKKAIRNGSLGMYGATYKLSTNIVCFWIREYLKSKNSKLL